jgi:hypothetical protein
MVVLSSMASLPPGAAAPAPFDAAVIRKLTNLNEINKLLHETLAKERAVDGELDKMLMKRGDLERSILSLNASTSEVRVRWARWAPIRRPGPPGRFIHVVLYPAHRRAPPAAPGRRLGGMHPPCARLPWRRNAATRRRLPDRRCWS